MKKLVGILVTFVSTVLIGGAFVPPVTAETMSFDPLKTKSFTTVEFTLTEAKAGQTDETITVDSGQDGYIKVRPVGLLGMTVSRTSGIKTGVSKLNELCKFGKDTKLVPCKKLNDSWVITGYDGLKTKYAIPSTDKLESYQRVLQTQPFTLMNHVRLINTSNYMIVEEVSLKGIDVNFNVVERSLKINVRPAVGKPVTTPEPLKEDEIVPDEKPVQPPEHKWGRITLSSTVLQNFVSTLGTGSNTEISGGLTLWPSSAFSVTPTMILMLSNAASKNCGIFVNGGGGNLFSPGIGFSLTLGDEIDSLRIGPSVRYYWGSSPTEQDRLVAGFEAKKIFDIFGTELELNGTAILKNINPVVVTGWVESRVQFLTYLQFITGVLYQNEPNGYLGLGAKIPILGSTMEIGLSGTLNGIAFGRVSWTF